MIVTSNKSCAPVGWGGLLGDDALATPIPGLVGVGARALATDDAGHSGKRSVKRPVRRWTGLPARHHDRLVLPEARRPAAPGALSPENP
jgi:hypothetical protein